MNKIDIKIGEFIQDHFDNIKKECERDKAELLSLQEKEYSKIYLGLNANFPFLKKVNEINEQNNERYWKKELLINNIKYRVCSQFGGSKEIDGKTRSQKEGEIFCHYLKNKNILLPKYAKADSIEFIVGGRNSYNKVENVSNKDYKNIIKNIILYGSPGVGKTHNTNKLISLIEEGKGDRDIFEAIKLNEESDSVDISNIKERVKFVTFHQSFGYEDFIEGFRPNEKGNIELVDGIFKEICKNADEDRDNNYYLVIDEINRGNISKIFGELITLIEEDKRDNLEVTLPYSKQLFKIPSNLYIIGTMNSTDKSIALIDIALRRRFTFLKMEPNAELIIFDKAKEIFKKLNEKITEDLGEDYQIGHSYFMKVESDNDLDFVCEYKIIPLLEEYYYGDDRFKEIAKICRI